MKHRSRDDNYRRLLSGVRISARNIDHHGSWHADSVTMGSSPGKNWGNAAHVHIWQRLNSDAKRVSRGKIAKFRVDLFALARLATALE